MIRDPYKADILKSNPYSDRLNISGLLVAIMDYSCSNRGLQLIPQPTRALKKYEIHELILTDEDPMVGEKVDSISYLGFCEISQGGIIKVGDKLKIGDKIVGEVVGFDETHMPNHLNIVIKSNVKNTGVELGLKLGDMIHFITK